MSKTKKTANNKVSNNNIIKTYHFTFSFIEVQLDNIETGIIIAVNITK